MMNSVEHIAVIGLGYVGLPLALLAEEKGFKVTGIDLDEEKLGKLNDKRPVIDDTDANRRLAKTNIKFSNDITLLQDVDAAIVCVPTPVDDQKNPNLEPVKGASISAAQNLKPGRLLIIESTINPGVCDEVLIPLIESETTHTVGKTLHLAHCPERINPGDPKWHVGNINRVLGADSEKALELAYDFYDRLVHADIKKMAGLKEAEAVKVVENSFRDINIAFVNELAMSFEKLGINVTNVIDGAATKPFAFMAHYPGIGVGGHCIPVDPYYLIEYARNNDFDHKFISLARNINESMPVYVLDMLERHLASKTDQPLNGCRVTVLGMSYKANVGDDRESPAHIVINELKNRGANITSYDPHMPEKSTVTTLQAAVENSQVIILVTAHNEFLEELPSADLGALEAFVDGRNALGGMRKKLAQQGVTYLGIGT